MKYVVTGANGYIGTHIVRKLLDKGHVVYVSDLDYSGVDSRAIQTNVDIFSGREDLYEQLGAPEICIHLAYRNGFVHDAHSHIEDISRHFDFLSNLMKKGLKQLVVMGSMHEVGYWEGAIDENTPTNPRSFYGIAKNSLRQLLALEAEKSNVTLQWIRGYYILGDDLKNHSVFSKIILAEQEGKESFPFNSGKNQYDFITVDELAEQIVAVSSQTDVDGIINCCSGKPVALGIKVEEFLRERNFKIKLAYGVFPDRSYDSPAVWGDTSKIDRIMDKYEKN